MENSEIIRIFVVPKTTIQIDLAMFSECIVTEIFFMADEFCKVYERMVAKSSLKSAEMPKKRKYHRASTLSDAEIMVILIMFHDSGYRCLKHFYLEYVCIHLRHLFPKAVSYNRFVELEKKVMFPLTVFIKKVLLANAPALVSWTLLPYAYAGIKEYICTRLSRGLQHEESAQWDGSLDSNCT